MARLQKRTQAAVTTGSAETSGIPRAMVLTFIRALPGDRLDCPRLRDAKHHRVATTRERVAQTSAPGGQDHTISGPQWLRSSCASDRVRRSPPPRIVTIANAPLG
jgi:hypothetical protein